MARLPRYNPADIFYDEYDVSMCERNDALGDNVGLYRTKTTKCGSGSGHICEVDIYPVMKRGVRIEPQSGKTSKAQREVNHRNTQRKISQLLNANFCDSSNVYATFGYSEKYLPETFEEATANLINYLRKLKRLIKRVNELILETRQCKFDFMNERPRISISEFEVALKEYGNSVGLKKNFGKIALYLAQNADKQLEPLKYLYVTEMSQNGRFHHHFVTNFFDRDIIECFWKFGERNQTRRVKPDKDFGLAGLANYLSKDYGYKKDYEKSYGSSANLYRPYNYSTTSDTKASKRQASGIANDYAKAVSWFTRKYPNYVLLEAPSVRTNNYFGGYWIYARLKRL